MSISSQRGFTLVEVIVALAITGLIMATVGSALFGMAQGFARVTERAQHQDRVFRVSQALRNSLARMTVPRYGKPVAPLRGEPGRLTWLSPLPESAPHAGLYQWELEGSSGVLRLHLTDHSQAQSLPDKVLSSDLTSLSFEFQGPDGHWQDAWSEASPPLRIRIRIATRAEGGWPLLSVATGKAL
jgi:prepilin-type N-terminal cleavage/methylation domain-containing protein